MSDTYKLWECTNCVENIDLRCIKVCCNRPAVCFTTGNHVTNYQLLSDCPEIDKFIRSHRLVETFGFGKAMEHMRAGRKVSRQSWGEQVRYLKINCNGALVYKSSKYGAENETDIPTKFIMASDWYVVD